MFGIGEAARRSGMGIEAIRFYEREGIVPKPARAANGRRLFSDAEIDRLSFLRQCRDLGFPLAASRALLDLSDAETPDCDAARAFGEVHLRTVRRKIRELRALEAALAALAEGCRAGSPHCPILDRLEQS